MGGVRGIRGPLIVMGVMAAIGVTIFVARSCGVHETRPEARSNASPANERAFVEGLPLPKLDAPVVDTTGTFTEDERDELAGELEYLEVRSGGPMYVVIVAMTGDEGLDGFAQRLEEACNQGRPPERECTLIVVEKGTREVTLEVGTPMEKVLPGSKINRVAAQAMAQTFRTGKYFEGISAALNAIEAAVVIVTPEPVVEGGPAADAAGQNTDILHGYDPLEDWQLWVLTVLAAIAGIALRVVLSGHGFISGSLGVVGGAGVLWIAQLVFDDILPGVPGAVLLATIAMGFGWFWLWFLVNLLFQLLIEAITGGGGGGGGFGGGGGGFGGGGASGSW